MSFSTLILPLLIGCHGLLAVTDLPASPCPSVLTYMPAESEPGSWIAQIALAPEEPLRGVWLHVVLDKKANSLLNWFAPASSLDNREFSIRNPEYNLTLDGNAQVKIRVLYNAADAAPVVKSIRLNGWPICPKTQAIVDTSSPSSDRPVTSTPWSGRAQNESTRPPVFLGDFSLFGTRGQHPAKSVAIEPIRCGVPARRATPLITNGRASREGAWPWHIAIYVLDGLQLKYSCGGSLVSRLHVVTAAHCVTQPDTPLPSSPDSFLIHLGRTHLARIERGAQERHVDAIRVHPDFNHTYYHNDIAVLTLAEPVAYTTHVRPVCLWAARTPAEDAIVDRLGTVVGWGYDAHHVISDTLQEIQMPVVDLLRCIYSNPDVYNRFTSVNSFCAGFRNGTSVCNGDSGGGMFFERPDPKGGVHWELRGLVSVSLVLQQRFCDPFSYTVFTDLAKFGEWLLENTK